MSKLKITYPDNSFKHQFIKFVCEQQNGIDNNEEISRLGVTSISRNCDDFGHTISIALIDGSKICVHKREIDSHNMKENKRKIIESNVYARMLNDAIESVKRGDINETIATIEARFNNQLKKEL